MKKYAKLFIFNFVFILGSFAPSYAAAQASMDRTEPAADSTVKKAPQKVRVWFDTNLASTMSTLQVKDQRMNRMDKNDVYQFSSNGIETSVGDLHPGLYYVNWTVITTDGHHNNGQFVFTLE